MYRANGSNGCVWFCLTVCRTVHLYLCVSIWISMPVCVCVCVCVCVSVTAWVWSRQVSPPRWSMGPARFSPLENPVSGRQFLWLCRLEDDGKQHLGCLSHVYHTEITLQLGRWTLTSLFCITAEEKLLQYCRQTWIFCYTGFLWVIANDACLMVDCRSCVVCCSWYFTLFENLENQRLLPHLGLCVYFHWLHYVVYLLHGSSGSLDPSLADAQGFYFLLNAGARCIDSADICLIFGLKHLHTNPSVGNTNLLSVCCCAETHTCITKSVITTGSPRSRCSVLHSEQSWWVLKDEGAQRTTAAEPFSNMHAAWCKSLWATWGRTPAA